MKKISLCITIYDEPLNIIQDIEKQAKKQKNKFFEILCFNDNPKRKMFSKYFHIFNSKKNRGPCFARNFLAKKSKGQYLRFQDADDWLHPKIVFEISKKAKLMPDVIINNISKSETHKPKFKNKISCIDKITTSSFLNYAIHHGFHVPSFTFKRKFFFKIKGFDLRMKQSEDYELGLRVALSKPKFRKITKSLVCIRSRPNSRSTRHEEVYKFGILALIKHKKQLFRTARKETLDSLSKFCSVLIQKGFSKSANIGLKIISQERVTDFPHRSREFNKIALFLGLKNTEKLGIIYRALVPKWIWGKEE